MVLVLTRNHIESLISMQDAIQAVEQAFLEIAKGKALYPTRLYLDLPKYNGGILVSLGYLEDLKELGIKIASSYPDNKNKGLFTVSSLIILNDPETGYPEAVLEGNYITSIKTGAVGAIAVKYLARKNSEILLIIGAGEQAKAQLSAIVHVTNIKKVLVFSRTRISIERFINEMRRKVNLDYEIVENLEKAIGKADIIVTATTSKIPVISGEHVNKGTHINGIGSFTPDAAEIDTISFEKAGKVFVDNYEAKNVGDIRFALEKGAIKETDIYHLADVVSGKMKGRNNENDITIFKSVGGAPYDLAVSWLVYNRAKKEGIGIDISIY